MGIHFNLIQNQHAIIPFTYPKKHFTTEKKICIKKYNHVNFFFFILTRQKIHKEYLLTKQYPIQWPRQDKLSVLLTLFQHVETCFNLRSLTKYLAKNRKIKQIQIRPENFNVFANVLTAVCQNLISGWENGLQAMSPLNFSIFLYFITSGFLYTS